MALLRFVLNAFKVFDKDGNGFIRFVCNAFKVFDKD